MLKPITEARDLKGKKVFVRVDWNVPIKRDEILDDFRIKATLPTLNYLQQSGAQVTLATHLDGENASVNPLRKFVPEGMILLENLRNNPGEESSDEGFVRDLVKDHDVYVNEAFGSSHREHASIVEIPKFLPSYIGLQFEKEIAHLSKALHPTHPFLFILGGAKFETKLPVLKKFVDVADTIFVGGALAHNFFVEQGKNVGSSVVSEGEFNLNPVFSTGKIILPENLRVKTNSGMTYETIDHVGDRDIIVDAGPKDLEKLKEIIESSSLILWNGPLGNYEKGFVDSTVELAKMLSESGKDVIVGGGDTVAAIKELGIIDKFSFVSTGGGAMLTYLVEGTLAGIEALK